MFNYFKKNIKINVVNYFFSPFFFVGGVVIILLSKTTLYFDKYYKNIKKYLYNIDDYFLIFIELSIPLIFMCSLTKVLYKFSYPNKFIKH